jgi:hypothetical protein
MTLAEQGRALIQRLQDDLKMPQRERDTGASDEQIAVAARLLTEMIKTLESKQLPPSNRRHSELTRLINDSWSLRSDIAADLARFEEAYRRSATRPQSKRD